MANIWYLGGTHRVWPGVVLRIVLALNFRDPQGLLLPDRKDVGLVLGFMP